MSSTVSITLSTLSSSMSSSMSTALSILSSSMSSSMSTALSTLSTLSYKVLQYLTQLSPPSIWYPFMEMVGKQFFHLWKRSGQSSKRQFLLLMETVGKQFSPFIELLVQLRLTVCATVSYYLGNCVLLFVQLCLTTWATVSYCLWKCLANSPPIYRTVLGTVLKQFSGKQSSPFMELFRQLCLTTWATMSYGLWKCLARSFPIYGNGFRSCTSENQRLHKELSNSKNRVTYRLR
jgi:hypothetical protein